MDILSRNKFSNLFRSRVENEANKSIHIQILIWQKKNKIKCLKFDLVDISESVKRHEKRLNSRKFNSKVIMRFEITMGIFHKRAQT